MFKNKIFNSLVKNSKLFDSHCHLNDSKYDGDLDTIILNMKNKNVEAVVDIAIDYASSKKALDNSRKYENLYVSIGVDMETCVIGSDLYIDSFENVLNEFEKCRELLKEAVNLSLKLDNRSKIAMIGETGIDLYWNRVNNIGSKEFEHSKEMQIELFQKHISLAKEYRLPLSIHSRDSIDECLEVIKESNFPDSKTINGVFHSLTPEFDDDEKSFYNKINQIHELGFMIGLNGIITFKKAELLRNTVLRVLSERSAGFVIKLGGDNEYNKLSKIYDSGFVFETDGPWLAPEGKRGERNEPSYVEIIYESIS